MGYIMMSRIKRLIGTVMMCSLTCVFSGSATWAETSSISPNNTLSAAEVIKIQLTALQQNDTPSQDAGIERTWDFAHPANKSMTGPLAKFAAMIKGAAYSPLIDHREHRINLISDQTDKKLFDVIIVSKNGVVLGYSWEVMKVLDGRFSGAWMTTAVSPPVNLGQAS